MPSEIDVGDQVSIQPSQALLRLLQQHIASHAAQDLRLGIRRIPVRFGLKRQVVALCRSLRRGPAAQSLPEALRPGSECSAAW